MNMLFPFRLAHALYMKLPDQLAHVPEIGVGVDYGYPD
jgi:hypothetical protein